MRLATVEQSRKIEMESMECYGLTGEILMESAGALAAREVDQTYFPELKRGLTAIICGPGNNGGDGLVVARHLHSAGHRNICIYVLGEESNQSDLFKLQLERAELQGLKIVSGEDSPEKMNQVKSASLVVDALFGIGLSRELSGSFLKAVELMNSTKSPVVSLDCPTGLDCDRGMAEGAVVKAAMTITFGLAKPGFFSADGPLHVGKLRILPIGFPHEALRSVATTHFLFNEKLARRYLPKRGVRSNKSDHGRVAVIAGSEGMWGAGLLCASSAYRVGAGYVTWASFQSPSQFLNEVPEILTTGTDDPELFAAENLSVAVGPGLGVGEPTAEVIEKLKKTDFSVVLDADAISTCVKFDLFPVPKTWVITPHAGELSRIIDMSVGEIESDRYLAALKGAEVTGGHLLLKGYRSVLAYGHRAMVVNAGNSALAKAGTGDVLTGMIAGLLAQNVEPVQATATAAYIHGRMADEWVRSGHDRRSLNASDLRNHLPTLMSRLATGALV